MKNLFKVLSIALSGIFFMNVSTQAEDSILDRAKAKLKEAQRAVEDAYDKHVKVHVDKIRDHVNKVIGDLKGQIPKEHRDALEDAKDALHDGIRDITNNMKKGYKELKRKD